MTISDFSDLYDQASFFKRPRRDFRWMGVRNFMTEVLMGELLEDELARSNIAENEDVKRVLKNKEEELMVGRLYEEMVNSHTVITAKAIRDYYRENIDLFKVPEKRTFGVVLTNGQDEALIAYNELQDGALFRTVAMAYSIDPSLRTNMGESPQLSEGAQPEMDPVGFALPRVGAYSEPFQTARGWMILKLVEVVEERIFTMEEAEAQVQSGLKQMANEDRLEELLEKWKEEIGIVIHEDRLDKVQIEERSASEEAAAPTT
jgi:parvulin-like peptidyl-prolyl isomerase